MEWFFRFSKQKNTESEFDVFNVYTVVFVFNDVPLSSL
jgi:hypothetical protein